MTNEFNLNLQSLKLLWQDSRLPFFVRFLIFGSLIYLICPLDLISDFLANGLFDDSIICPLLAIGALGLVPRKLWQEARELAAGNKVGIIGLACLGTLFTEALSVEAFQLDFGKMTAEHRYAAFNIDSKRLKTVSECSFSSPENLRHTAITELDCYAAMFRDFSDFRLRCCGKPDLVESKGLAADCPNPPALWVSGRSRLCSSGDDPADASFAVGESEFVFQNSKTVIHKQWRSCCFSVFHKTGVLI